MDTYNFRAHIEIPVEDDGTSGGKVRLMLWDDHCIRDLLEMDASRRDAVDTMLHLILERNGIEPMDVQVADRHRGDIVDRGEYTLIEALEQQWREKQ